MHKIFTQRKHFLSWEICVEKAGNLKKLVNQKVGETHFQEGETPATSQNSSRV